MHTGCHLRAFGPLHERCRRHRRRAPARRIREQGESPGPQPLQHLLLKHEVGQAPEHGAEQRRRGRRRVDLRRSRHRILWKRLSGCCGGAGFGGGGGSGSRAARSSLSWRFAGQPSSDVLAAAVSQFLVPRTGSFNFPSRPPSLWDAGGDRRGVREGSGGAGVGGGGGGGSCGLRGNLCGRSSLVALLGTL